jgi:pyruvate/2-oxoglutarate dehydrogenase complex dihydrolipoamide dehydrogenase (E3) component
MTAGFTGLNSAQAAKGGFSFFTSVTVDPNHASYYPGSTPMRIKIVTEEGTERLLGAQTVGEEPMANCISSRGWSRREIIRGLG